MEPNGLDGFTRLDNVSAEFFSHVSHLLLELTMEDDTASLLLSQPPSQLTFNSPSPFTASLYDGILLSPPPFGPEVSNPQPEYPFGYAAAAPGKGPIRSWIWQHSERRNRLGADIIQTLECLRSLESGNLVAR
jgi:hypothetical protein